MYVHLLNELSVDLDVIEGGSPVAKAYPTQNVRKGLQSSNLISLGDLSHHVLAFENVCLIYNFPLPTLSQLKNVLVALWSSIRNNGFTARKVWC